MSRESTSIAATPPTTGPVRQRVGVDPAPAADGATWTEYVAAARQLDGVRRGAATAATEQARAVQAAREELTGVRQRLAPQRSRLRELGVPPIVLAPSPPELNEAAREMAGGPSAVLTALRAARDWADGADGLLAARARIGPAPWPPRLRNLLVYGPLALVVPLLQVLLYVTTGAGPASLVALVCGLPMPAAAFVAGWFGVGRLFGGPSGPATERNADPHTAHNADRHSAQDTGGPTAQDTAGPPPLPSGERSAERPAGGAARGATAHGTASNQAGGDPVVVAGGGAAPVVPVGRDGAPGASAGSRLDRTPRWGALVCLVPAVLTTAGIVLAMLAG
ncbi:MULTISPECIES: hypothetical protein [unclassified Micromonospora]|uniref:hypothetical protein n=1 Tax=unclassified Micromonospora TaxID=2617518 RepID=UPI003640B44B